MEKLFAEYIPVEGEIKEGDKYLWDGKHIHECNTKNDADAIRLIADIAQRALDAPETEKDETIENIIEQYHKRKKVKLFLCSRDILAGDKVIEVIGMQGNIYREFIVTHIWNKDGTKMIGDDAESVSEGSVFKVLGEISSEAKWVKRGMEFDEESINKQCYDDTGDYEDPWLDHIEQEEYKWEDIPMKFRRIQIKGQCGHFH